MRQQKIGESKFGTEFGISGAPKDSMHYFRSGEENNELDYAGIEKEKVFDERCTCIKDEEESWQNFEYEWVLIDYIQCFPLLVWAAAV